jgi:short-subunit dehydrogenase
MIMKDKYGPWGVIAGGSDGTGLAFAHAMASGGINVVLVARRRDVLEAAAGEVRARHGVEVRTVALDLSAPGAIAELASATADLEAGLLVYNAGADDAIVGFLDKAPDAHLAMVHRNCTSVLEAAHHFGAPMVARGRGGMVIVTSGAAWAGGAGLATYGATKAFGLILAEALWTEWQASGVNVLALVLGRTDTPSLRRLLDATGQPHGDLASPDDIARQALDHLADGPTWQYGNTDPAGGSPFGTLSRADSVLFMSQGARGAESHS